MQYARDWRNKVAQQDGTRRWRKKVAQKVAQKGGARKWRKKVARVYTRHIEKY